MKATRIDIHFTTDKGERVATITPQDGHVRQILLDFTGPFKGEKPDFITLDAGPALSEGQGPEVCYLMDTGFVCW